MKNIHTQPGSFSYYMKPISNIIPCRVTSLESVFNFISMDFLKSVTKRVRSGELKKILALPFITVSGVFIRRAMEHIFSYSGIVSIDLDGVNIKLKHKLFKDPVLKPSLIFISPSKKGLKLFYRIRNASACHHNDYFNAISLYLNAKYRLKSDSACRDVSRACFLCYDPDALFSAAASVDSDILLEMIPPVPCLDEQMYITPDPVSYRRINRFVGGGTSTSNVAEAFRSYYRKTCLVYLFDKLNACPQVHDYAISVLRQNGWSSNEKYWTRPGKNPKEGHSAVFSFFDPYGIYLFTNFSDKGFPFVPNKSYSDCMIIAALVYNSDYRKCLDALMVDFNHLL